MAIPNPNPNIADSLKCDNKTYSSNKIDDLLSDKQDSDVLHIKETFKSSTSIVDAISSLITTYGKETMVFSFMITGYGWCSGMITFYDGNQGGGFVVCNNKGLGGNNPTMYFVQYVNGSIALGYPWVNPSP